VLARYSMLSSLFRGISGVWASLDLVLLGARLSWLQSIISQDNPEVLSQIIAVDTNESRLKLATDLGATHTINPEKEGVKARLSEITRQEGLDAAVDCSGVLSVINTMIESIGAGGVAVTIGNPGNDSKASVPILPFIAGAKTYSACHQGNADSKIGRLTLRQNCSELKLIDYRAVYSTSSQSIPARPTTSRSPTEKHTRQRTSTKRLQT
jgi:hypothetical protein